MRRAVIFLILFTASPAYAVSSSDLNKAVELNDRAVAKMKAGNYDGAELDLLAALEYANQNPKLRKNLGVVYYEKGTKALKQPDFYGAQKNLKLALEIDPDSAQYKKAYGRALYIEAGVKAQNGRNDEALRLYEQAAKMEPDSVDAWIQASNYAWNVQRLDKARDFLDRAKALDARHKNVLLMEDRLFKSSAESNFQKETSEHFIFSSATGYLDGGSQDILYDLERTHQEVAYQLDFYPKAKIPVVFYAQKDFHRHWKLPTRVSGYYDGKLRIPYPSAETPFEKIKPTLKHELTHAFVNAMTKNPVPRWANEGLAQWVEGRKLDGKARDAMVTHQITGRLPDIAHLDGALEAQKNPFNNREMTLFYMKSLSLIEFLIEQHGVWSVVQYFKDHDLSVPESQLFKKHFKRLPRDAEKDWQEWIGRKKY